MTTRLGVLEWMDDTTTLKEFLKEASSEQDSKAMEEVTIGVIIVPVVVPYTVASLLLENWKVLK